MVTVETRFNGEGLWRQLTLPLSVQTAQTVAGAAKTLQLGDQVKVVPGADPRPRLDIRV